MEKGIHKSNGFTFQKPLHAFCVYHIWKNVKVKYKVTLEVCFSELPKLQRRPSLPRPSKK